jgi:hypothetical protein
MAYTIHKTNGTIYATIADGTLDNGTSLTLVGKNYPGYGSILNENFIRLLENSANTSAPGSPVTGQLWWDSTNSLLKVYTGASFKNIGGSTSSASAPTGVVTGDLWWDTSNAQLKAYNGSSWTTIGPANTSGQGTSGAIVESVTDSLAVTHTIVSLYAANSRIAIVSKDTTFTPSPSITGFTTISPGINLASTGVIPNNGFTGLVTNANLLDSLDSTDFMRATTNTATTGTVAVNNNTGLTVGAAGDAKISVTSSNIIFENQNNSGSLILRVRDSGGTQTSAITVASTGITTFAKDIISAGNTNITASTASTTSTTGALIVAGGAGIAGNVNIGGSANITGNLSVTGNITLTGTQTLNGNVNLGDAIADNIVFNGLVASNIIPAANITYTLGNTTNRWSNVFAVASSAQYADLAERYEADREYPAGTVVSIGGDAEVTIATVASDVFGVVSTNPAFLMNDGAGNNATHPPVALVGRVPVRVQGKVNKGDKLIVGPAGVAIKYVPDVSTDPENVPAVTITQDQLVGRALADKYTEEEALLEVVLAAH